MFETRVATIEDARILAHHRHRMFVDAGRADNQVLRSMSDAFEPWVREMISNGKYVGWLIADVDKAGDKIGNQNDGKIVAGAGLMILDWPPHPLDPGRYRGYLLNVYVEPEYRRRKLASQLIDHALAEARRRNIRVVALHSTEAGRPLYESTGFRRTDEMFYVEEFSE